MSIRITPELFIETLTDMLEAERERKVVRFLSLHRAKTDRFISRTSTFPFDEMIAIDRVARRS